MGDGEVEEGECWEAFMFAAHYSLSNLCVFLDRNRLQIDGPTENVMSSEPLDDKFRAFNFNVLTIDGHDYDQIEKAFAAFHAESEKPTCILRTPSRARASPLWRTSWTGTARPPTTKSMRSGHGGADRSLCRAGRGGKVRWQM